MKLRDTIFIKSVRFNNNLSRFFTLLLLLASIRWSPFRLHPITLSMFVVSAVFTLIHEVYTRRVLAGKEPPWSLIMIPGILSLNVFVFLTGLWGTSPSKKHWELLSRLCHSSSSCRDSGNSHQCI